MLERLKTYLRPPVFADEEKTFAAGLVNIIAWAILLAVVVYTLLAPIAISRYGIAWLYVLGIATMVGGALWLLRRGSVRLAAWLLTGMLWLILTLAAYFNGGVLAPAYGGYVVVVVIGGLLLGWQSAVILALLSAGVGAVLLLLEAAGQLPEWISAYEAAAMWGAQVAYMLSAALLLTLTLRILQRGLARARWEIAERTQTEQSLRRSEQSFQAIFNSINDAIFIQDLADGHIVDVNQTMCEMYGYTKDEARRLSIEDLSAGYAPYTERDAAIHWANTSEAPQILEWLAKDRLGRLFWVEVNMRRAVVGEHERLLVVVRDIDDRKQAVEAERLREAYLRSILDNLPYLAWLKDAEGHFLAVNRFFALSAGQADTNALVGKTDLDFYPPDLAEKYRAEDLQVMAQGAQLFVEEFDLEQGAERWHETYKLPIWDAAGRVIGTTGVSRDITDRKQLEMRQDHLNRYLRLVIEAARELMDCPDLNTLQRRAVELAREQIGLERCSLYMLDEVRGVLIGTYGTTIDGQTIDERSAVISAEPLRTAPSPDRLWWSIESSLQNWEALTWRTVGRGWNAVTPISSSRHTLGVMFNDTALTHAPLDEVQQEVTAVYCSLLGSLIELKRTEADLAYEHDLLQSLMDSIPDLIYFKDTASRFMRVNKPQASLLGAASPADVIGKTDLDFQDPQLAQEFLAEEQDLIRTGRSIIDRVEYNPTPDGQPRWLAATKVPLRDAAGQVYGIAGVSRDITARKRTEDRQQIISRGLRAVIDTANELMAASDLNEFYRRAVELARERLGLERCGLYVIDPNGYLVGTYGTDAHGQTTDERAVQHEAAGHYALLTPRDQLWSVTEMDSLVYWADNVRHTIGSGWVAMTPLRSRARTLGVLYNDTAISHTPLNETQQEIIAVYCSMLGNLIERRQAERDLEHERDLLQALMDNIPDTIYFKDTDSRFTRINRAQTRMLGLDSPEAAVGKTDADFFSTDLSQTFMEEEHRLLSTGELIIDRLEYNPSLDGQPRWMSATKVPLRDRAGRIIGLVGLSRDITEHHLAIERASLTAHGLHAIIALADELLACTDLDELCRRAVELGRERLGLERCALFLYDEAQRQLVGTYGTDDRGQTSDEHGARLEGKDREELSTPPEQLWLVKHGERSYWNNQTPQRGASGWIACTLLRRRGQINGVLYNDSLLSGAPLNETQQEVTAVYCSMLGNLIELKRAEAAMRESEALFRNLADNAPAMIALTDEAGAVVYLNRAWQEYRDSDVAAQDSGWQMRFHPGDRDRYAYEYGAARQARRKYSLEYRVRRNDGQYRWLFDTSVPRFTTHGQFAGFISIAIDITDPKNAEEALLRSEARLRLITENMEDSVSQIDAQQRFVYVSPSMEQMSGYAPRELLGRPFLEKIHPDDVSRLQHQILMAVDLHLPTIRVEYRFRHVDLHEIWLEAEIRFMYDGAGELSGAILSARDISMRKRAEEDRENLIRELEDKNAELERFTYTVSHDLKSPLITIRGFLGFLEKDARAGNYDRLRADLQRISEATTRMQRLLDDLLELSRVGRLTNPPQTIPFDTIVREALDLVRGRLEARSVRVEVAPNLPTVYGDRIRLVEVVQNLVDNAAKFMGTQPEPHILIGALGDAQTGMPMFFVQDNGLGIDPQYHERVFGLFNKLDAQSEGTGVGLALVKRIIDLQNGHIWVESDGLGKGTTFFFTLPLPPVSESK